MAAATFDLKEAVGKNRQMTSRRVEITKRLDFSVHNLAITEDAEFLKLPKGYIHERCDPYLVTAEGGVATINIGTEADPDGAVDGGDVNGSAGAAIALAGTEAFAAGTNLSEALIRVTAVAAVDAAVVDVTFVGYIQKNLG